ncbi:hypothetical protein OS965_02155 [Streptomyces sp. H27-G5]|uniref:hypothetical protein n=1 Tax=Streptomyces sp. H27-G5 TaxID=2996698 RepID=UPI00226E097B|nr:hypothetical protein [Streptomyces sp. H27-G5]MCY0916978.1 hypothetical protein [Streptomyces sp. H27-G5]
MPAVQPALDGTIPAPKIPAARRKAEDFETWIDEVWPVYVTVAATTRTWTFAEIADEHRLPEPPDSHQWGRLATLLKEAGYTRTAGWATSPRPTVHHSGVRTWKGTPAARRETAA